MCVSVIAFINIELCICLTFYWLLGGFHAFLDDFIWWALMPGKHSQGTWDRRQVGSRVGGGKTANEDTVCSSHGSKKHQIAIYCRSRKSNHFTCIELNHRPVSPFGALYAWGSLSSCDFTGLIKFLLEEQTSQLSLGKALCMDSA